MAKINDQEDFGLCMNCAVRMFRRNGDMKLFHIIDRFFRKYISYFSDSAIICSIRDLQPESIEGEKFSKEAWNEVLPLHDFLLKMFAGRKIEEEKETPKAWVLGSIASNSECIGGRFRTQADFDKWTMNQDFSSVYPFIDAGSFEIDEEDVEDFNVLLLTMLEYSAPRSTYMPVSCTNLIHSNAALVTKEAKKKMIAVIEDTAKRFEENGTKIGGWNGMDRSMIKLKSKLEQLSHV